MIHILLTILKVLGIVLLALLALLLMIIIIVLFVPIRYRISGDKSDETINGKVRVSWLFGIIACFVLYHEKKVEFKVKVLGINILKFFKKKAAKDNASTNEAEVQLNNSKKSSISEKNTNKIRETSGNETDTKKVADENDQDKEKPVVEKETIIGKVKKVFSKVTSTIEKIKLTIQNICGKIRYWKDFIADQRVKNALLLVKNHLIKLIRHIMPKKIKGHLTFGFDDPCKTGQILAGASVLYPVYYKSLTLCPDFSGPVLNGQLDIRGRIYLFYMVKSALQIFFNKNIQFIIHTFRNKEES